MWSCTFHSFHKRMHIHTLRNLVNLTDGQAREITHHTANNNRICAYHCHQPVTKVDETTDRDRYTSPIGAKHYGLVDAIIGGKAATMVVEGVELMDIYKTKQGYISWGDDEHAR